MIRQVWCRGRSRVMMLMVVLVVLSPGVSPGPTGRAQSKEQVRQAFKPYVDYLNEFSARRRVNVFFPNQQSIFGGALVGLVHVGWGNLTFVRRDLVTVGRRPLMVARVYDSRLTEGEDFGPGWRLSAAETIRVKPDGSLVLWTESAAAVRLLPRGEGFRPWPPRPTDMVAVRQVDGDHFRVELRTGLVKAYTRLGDRYRLTQVEDRSGNRVVLVYAAGRLVELRGGNHRWIRIERDRWGRIRRVVDDQGRQVHYRYDEGGRLRRVIDLGGQSWWYTYDEAGRLVGVRDPLGHDALVVGYDAAGRVRLVRQWGQEYRYRYDAVARRTVVIDGRGLASAYEQNAAGVTVAVRNPLGVATRLELDEGNRVRRLYRGGVVVAEMSYDERGRLRSLVRREGDEVKVMEYVYDGAGRLVAIRGGGEEVAFRYDERGQVVERADGEGVRRYRYSPRGDLVGLERADGRAYGFEVDGDGQIVGVEDEMGRRVQLWYDGVGRLRRVRFADGSARTYQYDRRGLRRLTEVEEGGWVEYVYNAVGSLIEVHVVGEDGVVRRQVLTVDEGQRVRVMESDVGERVDVRYDGMGNVVAVTAGGQTMRFSYDEVNRLVEVVTVEGERLQYSYAEGEPDIRLQLDEHTRLGVSGRRDGGETFGWGWEVVRDRTVGSEFGVVRYDGGLVAYRLVSGYGVVVPDAGLMGILGRMRVLAVVAGGEEEQFDAPSNVVFWPGEYGAVNCCPLCPPWLRVCFLCGPGSGGSGGGGQQQGPQVTVSGPDKVPLRASGTSQGQNAIQLTASGTPAGGSYQWSTTSSQVSLSGTSTPQVTVTAVSASAMRDDVTVTVTYTVDGQSVSANKQLTVVKPTSLQRGTDDFNANGKDCRPEIGIDCKSFLRTLNYTIKDQFGDTFGPWTFYANESFTGFTSTCGASQPRASGRSGTGTGFTDDFWFCSRACSRCDPNGRGCTNVATQKWFVNGFLVRTTRVTWTCDDATIQ